LSAKTKGQSQSTAPNRRQSIESKAQTYLLAAPVRPGATHNKIDQGRSLTLRAPQGCLRVWVRRIQPTMREHGQPSPTTWILPGPRKYTCASEFTSSRLPTIHLSKSLLRCYASNLYRFTAAPLFFPQARRSVSLPGRGRGNHIVHPAPVNGCREDFLQTFTTSRLTRSKPVTRPASTTRRRLANPVAHSTSA